MMKKNRSGNDAIDEKKASAYLESRGALAKRVAELERKLREEEQKIKNVSWFVLIPSWDAN
jgi:hypothetical protein